MRNKGNIFKLLPLYYHCHNAPKRKIIARKEHCISGQISLGPLFPIQTWGCLIKQATSTLKLLCPSRLNPNFSSETQLNDVFDFNMTPMDTPRKSNHT